MLRKDAGHQRSNRKNTFYFLSPLARADIRRLRRRRREMKFPLPPLLAACTNLSRIDRLLIPLAWRMSTMAAPSYFHLLNLPSFGRNWQARFLFSMSSAFEDRGRIKHTQRSVLSWARSPLAATVLFAEKSLLSHVTSWELQLKKERREVFFLNYIERASQSSKIIEVTFHLRPPYMLHKEGRRAWKRIRLLLL